MEMYNVSGHGNAESYLIQGAEINNHLANPLPEQVEAMYTEATPEFFVDQGLYYPTATNYGYYCTGFESPGEWEDHQRVFGIDGPEVQYAGAQTESLPYVYYTPSYGYAQSPYNPYNPYIPGAMMGADGSYVGAQQYYTMPPYQDSVSSPGYIPVIFQTDVNPNSLVEPLIETGVASAGRSDSRNWKHGLASSSTAFPRNLAKPSLNQTNSLSKISEVPRANAGTGKQSMTSGNISSGFRTPSSRVFQSRSASGSIQAFDNISSGKVLPRSNPLKVSLPVNSGFSDFGPSAHARTGMDKIRTKFHGARTLNDVNGNLDGLGEQNRGPRTNKLKNQFAVKAYTTKVGNSNSQGNIIICTDHYNRDDFQVDYVDAKFFVIKSYSEDDVHKSIKYNVWSSTPHGNKKLQGAYEEAQKIAAGRPGGCPIFLFFSVNASGQFCGVAEMIGPVDFHKDMDFWQQDKWSGSFPVKWHIIKDVPNTIVKHIILENNENKPVTNSRDTQEIIYKQGMEMLKIFKNHTLKTSLLDDFMYYENRQKVIQEEKTRFIFRSFEAPLLVPALDPNQKINGPAELSSIKEDKIVEQNHANYLKETELCTAVQVYSNSSDPNLIVGENSIKTGVKAEDDIAAAMEIGSLDINTKPVGSKLLPDAATSVASDERIEVVTVGSVPVKVNGFAEPSSFLTVGTIPLDPRALRVEKGSAFPKHASQSN